MEPQAKHSRVVLDYKARLDSVFELPPPPLKAEDISEGLSAPALFSLRDKVPNLTGSLSFHFPGRVGRVARVGACADRLSAPSLPGNYGRAGKHELLEQQRAPLNSHETPQGKAASGTQEGKGREPRTYVQGIPVVPSKGTGISHTLILPTSFSVNSDLASGHSMLFDLSKGINPPLFLSKPAHQKCL